jgi:hypothetical protein
MLKHTSNLNLTSLADCIFYETQVKFFRSVLFFVAEHLLVLCTQIVLLQKVLVALFIYLLALGRFFFSLVKRVDASLRQVVAAGLRHSVVVLSTKLLGW